MVAHFDDLVRLLATLLRSLGVIDEDGSTGKDQNWKETSRCPVWEGEGGGVVLRRMVIC